MVGNKPNVVCDNDTDLQSWWPQKCRPWFTFFTPRVYIMCPHNYVDYSFLLEKFWTCNHISAMNLYVMIKLNESKNCSDDYFEAFTKPKVKLNSLVEVINISFLLYDRCTNNRQQLPPSRKGRHPKKVNKYRRRYTLICGAYAFRGLYRI